jgi:hypothetical protein
MEAFLTSFGVARCRAAGKTPSRSMCLRCHRGSGHGSSGIRAATSSPISMSPAASDLRVVGSSCFREAVASMLILLGLGVPRS